MILYLVTVNRRQYVVLYSVGCVKSRLHSPPRKLCNTRRSTVWLLATSRDGNFVRNVYDAGWNTATLYWQNSWHSDKKSIRGRGLADMVERGCVVHSKHSLKSIGQLKEISMKVFRGVRIRSHDPIEFRNLTNTSLSKLPSLLKSSWRSDQLFQIYEQNCCKVPYISMINNLS